MLKTERFVFNPFYENTYLIWDSKSKRAAIIDPGCYDDRERRAVDDFIDVNGLHLENLINTHCHIDHVFGNSYFKTKYSAKFLAPEGDSFLLDLMINTAKQYQVDFTPSPKPDGLIKDGDVLELGGCTGKFLFTPGHSPGEMCLYFEREKICFTGDVLFKGSIGRTDLWEGSTAALLNSIRAKLFTLPDDVVIYPGHESHSTIGYEKKHNQFLQ